MANSSNERSRILPTTTGSAQPANGAWRRRGAFLAAGAVTLAALAVVSLNSSLNFTSPPTTSVSVETSVPHTFTPTVTFPADALGRRELLPFCEERYITQPLDQFILTDDGTFEQRYYVCGQQFFNKENGTIFFYNGNEGDVLLYLNNTGLMWENAEEFNALLVFAEHRYFGKSKPFASDVLYDNLQFLSSTQALADYAVLIEQLKQELDADVPVIGFGGSYGGMLSAWFRSKYPHIMDGVIAASAPLLQVTTDPERAIDSEAFMNTVVYDMLPAAGASANCSTNMKKALDALARLSETPEGRETVTQELRLCDAQIFQSPADAQTLAATTADVFGNLAMGNYPYPSSYMMEGLVNLPAYPMRAACEHLAPDFGNDDAAVLGAVRDALGVYYNATGETQCLFAPDPKGGVEDVDKGNFWGYLACTELYMPLSNHGANGVFPAQPSNLTLDDANCFKTWGAHIRPRWVVTQYGGLRALRAASNIVFSNGKFDPFSGNGVLSDLSESVVAVPVEGGGHHVDLFFSHPLDPPSITQARETEKQHMRKWIREFYDRKRPQK